MCPTASRVDQAALAFVGFFFYLSICFNLFETGPHYIGWDGLCYLLGAGVAGMNQHVQQGFYFIISWVCDGGGSKKPVGTSQKHMT